METEVSEVVSEKASHWRNIMRATLCLVMLGITTPAFCNENEAHAKKDRTETRHGVKSVCETRDTGVLSFTSIKNKVCDEANGSVDQKSFWYSRFKDWGKNDKNEFNKIFGLKREVTKISMMKANLSPKEVEDSLRAAIFIAKSKGRWFVVKEACTGNFAGKIMLMNDLYFGFGHFGLDLKEVVRLFDDALKEQKVLYEDLNLEYKKFMQKHKDRDFAKDLASIDGDNINIEASLTALALIEFKDAKSLYLNVIAKAREKFSDNTELIDFLEEFEKHIQEFKPKGIIF